MKKTLRVLFCVIIGMSLQPAPTPAAASSYPERPMQLVVPFATDGTTDIAGRLIAVSGPVMFLASPLADYITGEILEVSGGLTLVA